MSLSHENGRSLAGKRHTANAPVWRRAPEPGPEKAEPGPSRPWKKAAHRPDKDPARALAWRKRQPGLAWAAAFLLLLLLGGGGWAYYAANSFLNTAPATPGATVEVEILRGDTLARAAQRLEAAGVITDAFRFRLLARWEGRGSSIQAGIFEFSTGWKPREVLEHLVFGQPVLYRLTIREGLPWWAVAKLAEEAGFAKAEDFKTVIHDPRFLEKHGIPFANAEGFLYPDTYFLRKPKELDEAAAQALADRLVNTFQAKTGELLAELDLDEAGLKRLIVLASMVEKETGLPEERARVAGVFANRIRLGMLMQCDPTIIYGLGENFSGNIRRRDLEDDKNLYNTYKHPGLPPGPICSPGYQAIYAAAHPEEHKYLYFVATSAGGAHIFSTNLKDHNNAVHKYQRNRN